LTIQPTDVSPAAATLSPVLSADEQRLLLVGLCDFEGRWDIFAAAASLVVDGATKAALIRDRLAPYAAQLTVLASEEVAAHQLWIARHWFDTQFCQAEASAEPPKKRVRARSRPDKGAQRTKQGDK